MEQSTLLILSLSATQGGYRTLSCIAALLASVLGCVARAPFGVRLGWPHTLALSCCCGTVQAGRHNWFALWFRRAEKVLSGIVEGLAAETFLAPFPNLIAFDDMHLPGITLQRACPWDNKGSASDYMTTELSISALASALAKV